MRVDDARRKLPLAQTSAEATRWQGRPILTGGTGHPYGLAGEKISVGARIVSVEARTIRVFHSLRPVLPRHYRVVPADKIARALLEAAITAPPGVHIVESERL